MPEIMKIDSYINCPSSFVRCSFINVKYIVNLQSIERFAYFKGLMFDKAERMFSITRNIEIPSYKSLLNK